jgi:hypothetical protein
MGARCFVALVLVLLQGVAFALGQTMQPVAIAIAALYVVASGWACATRASSRRSAASPRCGC